MSGPEDMPLWLAVACWALTLNREVTRSDVSQAFAITPRRAGDVLGYILRCCRGQVTTEYCVQRIAERGGRRLCVRVLAVSDLPAGKRGQGDGEDLRPSAKAKARALTQRRQRERLSDMGRAFLQRRPLPPLAE